MHRTVLLALLEAYKPAGSETHCKQRMIDFIKTNPDCFERSLAIGHITASAWLLNKNGDKALLMHHMKLNRWVQLGGHCDGESDVLAVAIKEAQEESGINGVEAVSPAIFDIDIHRIPANSREQEHDHYDVRFLLRVTTDEQVVQNNESKELRWVGKNPEELPTQEESVARLFRKWVA